MRADDSDQGQASQGHHVLAVLRGLSAVSVRLGQLAKRPLGGRHPGDAASFPQLDPVRLHLRDQTYQHPDLQVPQRPHVQERHAQVSHGDRGRHRPPLRPDVRPAFHSVHGSAGDNVARGHQHQGGLCQRRRRRAAVHPGLGPVPLRLSQGPRVAGRKGGVERASTQSLALLAPHLRSRRSRDIQDLLGVLEQPDGRPLPRKPILFRLLAALHVQTVAVASRADFWRRRRYRKPPAKEVVLPAGVDQSPLHHDLQDGQAGGGVGGGERPGRGGA